MPDGETVRRMFGAIANRYDLANHLLSGGLDFYWRSRLVRAVRDCQPSKVLDLATGSGDVAIALKCTLGTEVQVTGMDFCCPMLVLAEEKKKKFPSSSEVEFRYGECLNLPREDNSVDVVTIAFGLRNLEDRHRGLQEMRRVLKKPGGKLIILEFSQPKRCFKPFYYFYLKRVLPRFGGLLTGQRAAYQYLSESIDAFPSLESLHEEIRQAGFSRTEATPLTFSTVTLHRAEV